MNWDTPRTMKALKKQMENYTIGNIQIDGFSGMMKNMRFQLRNLIAFVTTTAGMVGMLVSKHYIVTMALIVFWMAYLARRAHKVGISAFRVQIFNSYGPFIYMFRHRRYFDNEYKVIRYK